MEVENRRIISTTYRVYIDKIKIDIIRYNNIHHCKISTSLRSESKTT